MDKRNNFETFESIYKNYNEKKTLALYKEEEKHSTNISSKVLEPHDIIGTVSKQLKEIQKADYLRRDSAKQSLKWKQSDFLPINILYSEEGIQNHNVAKFETQCITDTQLIDIVDNVEAMVNVNVCMPQDCQTSSCYKKVNPNKITDEIKNKSSCSINDINVTESNINRESTNFQQFCNPKETLCIDEINTEIYKEFNLSYRGAHDDNTIITSNKKAPSLQHCNENISDVHTIQNFANDFREGILNSEDNIIQFKSNVIIENPSLTLKDKYNSYPKIKRKRRERTRSFKNDDSATEDVESDLQNNCLCEFNTDFNRANDCDISASKQRPSSPIFKSFKYKVKSKTPSPLVFALDAFEKFESFAMPLVEENIDFETTKYLINSQIIGNQLLISDSKVSVVKNSIDSFKFDNNNCDKEILKTIPSKNDQVAILLDSKPTINKSTTVEDNILFSSDEENDYFDFCQEDLPMTCAMKTSLYESEADLEKTMFVGFQTSSNKCIQVSKNSFDKARNIFDNIDKKQNVNLTLTEMLEMYENTDTNFNKNVSVISDSDDCSKKDNKNINSYTKGYFKIKEDENVKAEEKTKFPGFKTGNGKSIVISEKAFLKCNTVFKDILENENEGDINESNLLTRKQEFIGFMTARNKNGNISQASLVEPYNNFNDGDINVNNVSLLTQTVTDLNTAPAKPIAEKNQDINDINMNQTLLQEFENESIEEIIDEHNHIENNVLQTAPGIKTAKIKTKKSYATSSDSQHRDKYHVSDSYPNENFETGIPKYNNILDIQKTAMSFGFKTANNKEIKVTTEALMKTKNVFHDVGFEDLDIHEKDYIRHNTIEPKSEYTQPNFQGFKTASNKIVQVSKEALLKSEYLFQDINSIQNVTCNEDETRKTKRESNDTGNVLSNSINSFDPFSSEGFKTPISKSFNILKEAGRIRNVKPLETTNRIYKSDTGKPIYVSNDPIFNLNTGFQGFKTASNKSVVVSKESLSKTRMIFQNIEDIGNNENAQLQIAESVNVNMTSEKPIKNESAVKCKILDFPGFKTASHKQVAISVDALAKTKHLFKDIDYESNKFNNKENERTDFCLTALEGKHNMNTFTGFQTASNKAVKISDEAIARSRKIFDEINFDIPSSNEEINRNITCNNKENVEDTREKGNVPFIFQSKTATNKSVAISEESFKQSERIATDCVNEVKNMNKNVDEQPKKILGIDIENTHTKLHNTMDTQLLNNFEETLHTEDFYKDIVPEQCKRSGSPILSCPKAKKRKKFETPYKTEISVANIQNFVRNTKKNTNVKYNFTDNYKTVKLYSLKDLDKIDDKYMNTATDPYIKKFDFDTLLQFVFKSSRNDFTDEKWTTDNIKTCFLAAVDKKIVPESWLDNHLRSILWKLISYEIRFPNVLAGVCSVRNVLEQLKYRYDKELCHVERPALRKVLEKDDISTKFMVLAVVGVYVDGVLTHSITNLSTNVELLVTDGWYCVKACTDRMITRLVSEGKIAVGRKIATIGADLLNCEQGVSPWEDTSAVRLKLFGNCTRPARWDARLGFHANTAILCKLSTMDPSGGKVCKMRALVLRVYPTLYVEKLEDGSTVTRSERLENIHQIKFETERQNQLEKLYEEVEKEFLDQDSSGSESIDVELKRSHPSGSQLDKLMKRSNDPSQFRSHLTDSQALYLREYSSRRKEKIVEELQKKVQDRIQAQGLQIGRNVIPLLKIRVAGLEGADSGNISKAMVSIWRPNDAIFDVVKEGTWIDLFNVVPTAVRNSELQISAGRQSVFHRSKFKIKDKIKPYIELLERKCFTTQDLNQNPTMRTEFNEIDTVGVVFLIEPSLNDFETIKGQQFQNVYLTDIDKNFICINFWGGIKKFGYENIFESGNIVVCTNLQKRAGNTRKSIPQYRVTELTVFTKTPKLDYVKSKVEDLRIKLSGLNKRKFCEDCVLIKNNYATIKYGAEYSPYRINISDYSLTKNKLFIDSPLVQNKDVNFNLTGLDFESSFQQADNRELSPTTLKRKRIVNEKIAKLKMYGEPPPLSKIHLLNKSKNAGSVYKSPLTSNVARLKNLDNSPITTNKLIQPRRELSMNKTFVVKPDMYPVKLNFSGTSLDDNKTETNHFEEEFEASPPLSLE